MKRERRIAMVGFLLITSFCFRLDAAEGGYYDVGQTIDFNGDGKADILWRNWSTGVMSIWFIDGTTYLGSEVVIALSPSWEILP